MPNIKTYIKSVNIYIYISGIYKILIINLMCIVYYKNINMLKFCINLVFLSNIMKLNIINLNFMKNLIMKNMIDIK